MRTLTKIEWHYVIIRFILRADNVKTNIQKNRDGHRAVYLLNGNCRGSICCVVNDNGDITYCVRSSQSVDTNDCAEAIKKSKTLRIRTNWLS